jgi:hypothetical protein
MTTITTPTIKQHVSTGNYLDGQNQPTKFACKFCKYKGTLAVSVLDEGVGYSINLIDINTNCRVSMQYRFDLQEAYSIAEKTLSNI